MGSVRLRVVVAAGVVAAAAVGGWQFLPSSDDSDVPAIRVGTTDKSTSLDPAYAYDAGSWALYSNVFQSLLTLRTGSATPTEDAAKTGSCRFVGQKLMTYQCEVRDDLTFANGNKLTAEDVKFSFDRILRNGPDVGPRSLFTSLKSVSVSGQTVTFNLHTGDATFPFKVASGGGSIVDRTKYPAQGERKDPGVDGSGPYAMASYEKGRLARLVPSGTYRGAVAKVGAPIDVHYYAESKELQKAWETKEVDVTHRQLPPRMLANLAVGDPNVRISEVEATEIRNMVFNVRKGSAFEDASVRRAVSYLVNRPKLAIDVYHNTVDPLYDVIPKGVLAHGTPFFDRAPKPDLAKAQGELRKAGVRLPVQFSLGFATGGATRPEAEELKRQLELGGLFAVELVERKVWDDFQADYKAGKYDAYNIGWVADFPDPDNYSQPLVGKGNSNANGYVNPDVEKLIIRTQGASNRSDAVGDFKAMQRIVAQDVPLLPLWQTKDYVLSSNQVGGAQYLSDGTGIWRLWELHRL
ncbi:ABC transporter substrate-binding protein [Streptomyces candidus]|uniref:Peptide/nickel transport system substrate-binding protein n=1 Tax=Streptomyces candidus TaxID=67283 RepID=A0A7X0LP19_9ACTN|nr:ABC transporter substrate-binding protein [Streptomyces candidus]MBB6435044.1 peptide/nickel transport system substrate-binding protein [Streptomyces candidus]